MQTQEKPRDHWTDLEFIIAHGKDAQEQGRPYFLGELMRPGWTGRLATYVIWCEDCQFRENRGFSVTHEAGFDRRIACSTCHARFDLLLPLPHAIAQGRLRQALPGMLFFIALAAVLLAIMLR